MLNLKRTDSSNQNFQKLVQELDADLKIRDGEDHEFFAQFNKIDKINYVIVAYEEGEAVGCGAIKKYSDEIIEIKRMYVVPHKRSQGIASRILKELEFWAKELYFNKCILETGKKQPEAIGLYIKNNYITIPNFGQYEKVDNSVCFEKTI